MKSFFCIIFVWKQGKRGIMARKTMGGEQMKPLKEKISITIDSDILEQLKLQAESDDRSLSQYINLVLKRHLREKGKDFPSKN